MTYPIKAPRKLIEVALPLEAMNAESAKRKRKAPKGYPTTLHKWWAQRPIAAARGVLFAQLVNDPSWKWELEHPGVVPPNNLKATWAKSRQRLFKLIEELITWENTTNERVLEAARAEIRKSWSETCLANADHPQAKQLFDPERLPAFHDPFAGGGSIPLEAQRLGLESHATDLNPVAVLINKAMIELPFQRANQPPINSEAVGSKALFSREWKRASGLAEDVRYYGRWMRTEAEKRIGYLYPSVTVTEEMVKRRPDLRRYWNSELTVVACVWARTVKSPNPTFSSVDVPLTTTFMLSTKEGREAYIAPIVEGMNYRFEVRMGKPKDEKATKSGTKYAGSNFRCVMSDVPISGEYIKAEGIAGRLGTRLMAVVVEGQRERLYLSPTSQDSDAAFLAEPKWRPQGEVPTRLTGGNCVPYGLTSWADLFTSRQLVALTTLSDLIVEVRERVERDAVAAGSGVDEQSQQLARSYANTVSVYLGLAIGRLADYGSSISTWRPKDNAMRSSLAMQAIPMTWDFAEGFPFGGSSAGFEECVNVVAGVIEASLPAGEGEASQAAAQSVVLAHGRPVVVSTDPPYYNNIAYADLSDFFYAWLRPCLREVQPELFHTLATPKAEELVASPYRHGGVAQAESFFLMGMTAAMGNVARQAHPAFPCTIYYAFKQSETSATDGTTSSGWETFLEAVVRAGLSIGGTWPMRTEGDNRQVGIGANALASSIVLVCRPRASDAATSDRRRFIAELRAVLPEALDAMTRGAEGWGSAVAPVDLSQAIIGPGMEVFTKYSAVLEADGSPMSVRTALMLINRFLVDDDFDADTQFCVAWFEQQGWKSGPFGSADTLARAKGTSVEGVKNAGVIHSAAGSVRLTRPAEYPSDWDPAADDRLPVWEVLHHLVRALRTDGERAAAAVLSGVQSRAGATRQLAYRLYTLCERAGWAEDARSYNDLIASWSAIEAATAVARGPVQQTLFES